MCARGCVTVSVCVWTVGLWVGVGVRVRMRGSIVWGSREAVYVWESRDAVRRGWGGEASCAACGSYAAVSMLD